MFRKVCAALAVLGTAIGTAPVTEAAAVSTAHGVIVSDDPVNNTPHVLDGRVYAIAKVGSKVVLGGEFTTARDQGFSNVQSRVNLLSYDFATGRIDQGFVPQVNGVVNALAADPSGTAVFVGGAFTTVNGLASRGLVKLNVADGTVVSTFKAPTTGAVFDLTVRGSTLYLGGVFGKVKGIDRPGLAAVNTTTGALDANLNLPVITPMFKGKAGVKKLDVTPDGTKLVIVGNFTSVGGQPRTQMALINLNTAPASVSSWQTDKYGNVCSQVFDTYMRDVDISPDGTFVAVVTTGGPRGFHNTLCDTVTRWDLDRTGPGQLPEWTDWTGGDTLLSVAVTDTAVYIGGHQRWMNNVGGSNLARPSAVAREGISAADPVNGRALSWNPGRTRGYGVTALLANEDGLYVGNDTESLGGEFHARIGMFPVAGGTAPVVVRKATSPTHLLLSKSDGRLYRTSFSTTPTGTTTVVSGPGVDSRNWSLVRGTFMINDRLYSIAQDGTLSFRTYDGTTFGPDTPFPSWQNFWYPTATTYDGKFLYYTKANDARLYRRGLGADGFVIDPIERVVSGEGDGLNWTNTVGLAVVDGRLLSATTTGDLISTALVRHRPVAGSGVTISGPGVDGRNWNGRELVAY